TRRPGDIRRDDAGWPEARISARLAPGRRASEVLMALRHMQGERIVAVVGHAPLVDELVTLCVGARAARPVVGLRKGAVACVELETDGRSSRGTLQWLLSARLLRDAGD